MKDYADKLYLREPAVKKSLIARIRDFITSRTTIDYQAIEDEYIQKSIRVEQQLRELRAKLAEQQKAMYGELKDSERNIDNSKRLWNHEPSVLTKRKS